MISSVSTDAHTAADRRNRASNSGKRRFEKEPAEPLHILQGELEGVEGEEMIIEILELAAALEWIALGVLVFFKLRS